MESLLKGRISTVDLLIRVACLVRNVNNIFSMKMSRLKLVSNGAQLYLAIPVSEGSLDYHIHKTS